MKSLSNFFIYTSSLSTLLPLVLWFSFKSNRKSYSLRIIALLLVISFSSDLASYITIVSGGKSNSIIFNIFWLLHFIILSSFYYTILKNKRGFIRVASFFYLLFVACFSANKGFHDFLDEIVPVQSIVFIVYCFQCYSYIIKELMPEKIFRLPLFWINTAVFSYFTLNLYLFGLEKYAFAYLPPDYSMALWIIHNINSILENILFAFGMYYTGKRATKLIDRSSPDFIHKLKLS